jgi:hypothetical protein
MKLVLFTIGLLLLAVIGFSVKILFKKDGKFSGTCASQSPFLNKDGESCGICGKSPDQMIDCKENKES